MYRKKRNAHGLFLVKLEGKQPLGTTKREWGIALKYESNSLQESGLD
jgi:hypothetical protein